MNLAKVFAKVLYSNSQIIKVVSWNKKKGFRSHYETNVHVKQSNSITLLGNLQLLNVLSSFNKSITV